MSGNMKKKIGENLRNLRKSRGFKQHELAELAGVEDKTISRIEVGGNYPSVALMVKLAEILYCELIDLVRTGEEKPLQSVFNELNTTEIKAVKKFIIFFGVKR